MQSDRTQKRLCSPRGCCRLQCTGCTSNRNLSLLSDSASGHGQVGGALSIKGADSLNTTITSSYFLTNAAQNFFGGALVLLLLTDFANQLLQGNRRLLPNTACTLSCCGAGDISIEPCNANLYSITNTVIYSSSSPITLGTTGCSATAVRSCASFHLTA